MARNQTTHTPELPVFPAGASIDADALQAACAAGASAEDILATCVVGATETPVVPAEPAPSIETPAEGA